MENQQLVEEKIRKANGDIIIHKYYKGRHLLGVNTTSKCYEFTSEETNKTFACKIIPKSSLEESQSIKKQRLTEISIHKSLHHSNIIEFHHYFEDTDNMYILLEMCQNQSLMDVLLRRKRLTELEVQFYLVQIIQGLKYLHSNRIIHRNIKLKNMFLTEKMELKIGGFLCVIKLENEGEKLTTKYGTLSHMAPEIFDDQIGYSYEVDIWSLGIIIYELLIGKLPFNPKDGLTIYEIIKSNDYSFPEDTIISNSAKNLISQILNSDPSKRPSLDQILNHDFFKQGTSIPKKLPTSFLSCAPSLPYIRKYMPSVEKDGIINKPLNITNTQLYSYNNNQIEDEEKNKIDNNVKELYLLKSKELDYKHDIDLKKQETQNNIVKNNHIENIKKIKNMNIEEMEKIKNKNKKDEYIHIEEIEKIKNKNKKDEYTHIEEMEKIKNKKEIDMKEMEYKLIEQNNKKK